MPRAFYRQRYPRREAHNPVAEAATLLPPSTWRDPPPPAPLRLAPAALLSALREDYNPDEPRDDHGRWTGGGDGVAATPAQEAALSDLSDRAGNATIQGVLRSGSGAMDTPVAGGRTVGEDVRQIDTALAQTTTTSDTTVYRGAAAVDVRPGDRFTDPGYVTTTTSGEAAYGYALHAQDLSPYDTGHLAVTTTTVGTAAVYEIRVPAGSNALDMGNGDVLLPHDSVFEVTGVEPGHVTMTYRGVAGG